MAMNQYDFGENKMTQGTSGEGGPVRDIFVGGEAIPHWMGLSRGNPYWESMAKAVGVDPSTIPEYGVMHLNMDEFTPDQMSNLNKEYNRQKKIYEDTHKRKVYQGLAKVAGLMAIGAAGAAASGAWAGAGAGAGGTAASTAAPGVYGGTNAGTISLITGGGGAGAGAGAGAGTGISTGASKAGWLSKLGMSKGSAAKIAGNAAMSAYGSYKEQGAQEKAAEYARSEALRREAWERDRVNRIRNGPLAKLAPHLMKQLLGIYHNTAGSRGGGLNLQTLQTMMGLNNLENMTPFNGWGE